MILEQAQHRGWSLDRDQFEMPIENRKRSRLIGTWGEHGLKWFTQE